MQASSWDFHVREPGLVSLRVQQPVIISINHQPWEWAYLGPCNLLGCAATWVSWSETSRRIAQMSSAKTHDPYDYKIVNDCLKPSFLLLCNRKLIYPCSFYSLDVDEGDGDDKDNNNIIWCCWKIIWAKQHFKNFACIISFDQSTILWGGTTLSLLYWWEN